MEAEVNMLRSESLDNNLTTNVFRPEENIRERSSRGGCSKVFWVLLGISVLFFVWLIAIATRSSSTFVDGKLEESIVSDVSSNDGKLVVIPLYGKISSGSSTPSKFSTGSTDERIIQMLSKALKDPDVNGVILDVNSPGGEVVASDNIYREVLKVKQKKPVVVYVSGLAASGSYYVSVAGDKIVAHPSSMIGSIGVIVSVYSLHDLYDKLGIKVKTFKTGAFKDSDAFFNASTSTEAEQMINNILQENYNIFVNIVSKERNMSVDDVKNIADGRVFSSREAQTLGLIDELGTFDTALQELKTLTKVENPKVVEYKRRSGFLDSLQERLGIMPLGEITKLHQDSTFKAYYLMDW